MRFSILLGTLAALTAVEGHPAPAPAPAASEGKSLSKIIHLKDIDPSAPNGELVIGTISTLPNTTSAPLQAPGHSDLEKRGWFTCYSPRPHWVSQSNLYSAIVGICNYLNDHDQVSYGSNSEVWWQHYQDGNGNWIHLTDSGGVQIQTKWNLHAASWVGWDWSMCYNSLFQLVWSCPGSNPDTAGGFLDDWNGWTNQLNIYDL
ncbi:hypothetical protein ABW20_dc0103864 [Dactylellina cionopaga]|nr:hypothetical protein ABW20_dc0103864 [Dactylellina cionopaga]